MTTQSTIYSSLLANAIGLSQLNNTNTLYVLNQSSTNVTISPYTTNGSGSNNATPGTVITTNGNDLANVTSIAVTSSGAYVSRNNGSTGYIHYIPFSYTTGTTTIVYTASVPIYFLTINNNLYAFGNGHLYYASVSTTPSQGSFTDITMTNMTNTTPGVTFDNNNNLYYIKGSSSTTTIDIYSGASSPSYTNSSSSFVIGSTITTPGGIGFNIPPGTNGYIYVENNVASGNIYSYPLLTTSPATISTTGTQYNTTSMTNPKFLSRDINFNLIALASTSLYLFTPLPPPIPSASGAACFLKGTFILTNNGYRLIEELKKGDLVNTLKNGFVPIDIISTEDIQPTDPCKLYKLSYPQYPHLWKDLYLTGSHSVLVGDLTEDQRIQIVKDYNQVFVTDGYYRLPIYLDEKVIKQEGGEYTVYHIVLEHENIQMNYGIYANGLLVESANKYDITKSSMVTD